MKRFVANIGSQEIEYFIERVDSKTLKVLVDGHEHLLDAIRVGPGHYSVIHNQRSFDINFSRSGTAFQGFVNGEECRFGLKDEKALRREQFGGGLGNASGHIVCPMPGKVIEVKVKLNQDVKAGAGVAVVEAMKMQNEFKTEIDGVVKEICVSAGDSVESGQTLIVIE